MARVVRTIELPQDEDRPARPVKKKGVRAGPAERAAPTASRTPVAPTVDDTGRMKKKGKKNVLVKEEKGIDISPRWKKGPEEC